MLHKRASELSNRETKAEEERQGKRWQGQGKRRQVRYAFIAEAEIKIFNLEILFYKIILPH